MPNTTAGIAQLLAAPESALREEGVALFVDHLLAHPLREVIDLPAARQLVLRAFTRENLGAITNRHTAPGFLRYLTRASQSELCIGELVPPEAQQKLRALADHPGRPRARWLVGSVDPALLRKLLGPVWMQLVLNFAKRFPLANAPAASQGGFGRGIASRLGRSVQHSAERLVDAGRSVMEGLGLDVEKRVQQAARDFSDGALAEFQGALRERLASEEGRALLAQIKRGAIDHVLRTRLADLHLDAAELPITELFELAPDVLAHAAPHAFVQEVVQAELDAFLAVEGDRALRDVLGELGLLDDVRRTMAARGDALLRSLAASPAFAAWLVRVLSAADG